MSKLHSHALGVAAAVIAALSMLIMGILAMAGVYMEAFQIMKAFHIGFDATIVGTLIGIIEAAVVSYIGGYLFGSVYNKFS